MAKILFISWHYMDFCWPPLIFGANIKWEMGVKILTQFLHRKKKTFGLPINFFLNPNDPSQEVLTKGLNAQKKN